MQPDINLEEDVTQDLTADLNGGGAPQARVKLSVGDSFRAAQARYAHAAEPSGLGIAGLAALPAALSPAAPTVAAVSEERISIAPGSLLCGRYLLELPLAKGGTAIVFRARDLQHTAADGQGSPIALKILRPEIAGDGSAVARLKREFRHAHSLPHPHIVKVFDLECDSGRWFMTMELLEGESLAALLKKKAGAALQTAQLQNVLRACGEALTCAHDKGIVHGDFKPGNVFLTRKGLVKVLDFGAATSVDPVMDEHFPAATMCYGSPEVLSGQRPEPQDDIFAFACVAYELIDGRHPFERRSALEANVRHMKPPRAWSLTDRQWFPLETALSFKRENRPPSIRPLLNELLSSDPLPPLLLPVSSDAAVMPAIFADEFPVAGVAPAALAEDPPRPAPLTPFRLIAAVATLALMIAVIYSQSQRNPQAVADLRARWAGFVERLQTNAPPARVKTPDTAPQPATIPADSAAAPAGGSPPASTFPSAPPSAAPAWAAPATDTPAARPRRHAAVVAADPSASTTSDISISFDSATMNVSEGAGAAVLTLRRQGSATGRARVMWRAIPGTAQPGQDYDASAYGSAEFADGQFRRAIYVPLIHDALRKPTREFTVELYNPAEGVQLWPVAKVTIRIQDDD